MKTFNVIFAIGAAAIGISGVMAKAVPQESIELPASILKAALAKRDVERLLPCWMAPDDSIKCPKSKREADAKLIRPCWGAPDNSIRCPVVKREPDGARCFGFVDGKECCPDRDCGTGQLITKRQLQTFPFDIPVEPGSSECLSNGQNGETITHPCPDGLKEPSVETLPTFPFDIPVEPGSSECLSNGQNGETITHPCPDELKNPSIGSPPVEPVPTFKWEFPVKTDKPGCWWQNQDGELIQHPCPKDCYLVEGGTFCSKAKRVDTVKKPAPAWPTLPGTFSPCAGWYPVTELDHHSGCLGIIAKYNITYNAFLSLNRDVNANCTNLRNGYGYCVAASTNDSTLSVPTSPPSPNVPSPTSVVSDPSSSPSSTVNTASPASPTSHIPASSTPLSPATPSADRNACTAIVLEGCEPIEAAAARTSKPKLRPPIRPTGIPRVQD